MMEQKMIRDKQMHLKSIKNWGINILKCFRIRTILHTEGPAIGWEAIISVKSEKSSFTTLCFTNDFYSNKSGPTRYIGSAFVPRTTLVFVGINTNIRKNFQDCRLAQFRLNV
ncbi:MAG: hypothetical protein KGY69_19780 [Bacteroidales bacterium]|nr:hypothetical protein [Bacteroidales bacterium]